jgi:alkanesulfonate monooxygenase SsuD/methylene tetrahydromethanopterin reductase-like flavin-dependent oxidoreductase (luciferase family)
MSFSSERSCSLAEQRPLCSFDNFTLEMFALGGGALPIFGTREQVAENLDRLYRSGMDGVLMVFLSYYEDTLRFQREIMPLLRQLGTIR